IKLERRGYNYWACCPFHHEKTPSFSVNAADRYYHCFGCGVSGDVIGFVKEYENVDFTQAVQILAARVNLEVPAFDDRTQERTEEKKKKKDRLSSLMRDAARFYLNNLYSGEAEEHLKYLEKRRIAPSTMKKFGIGASLDYTSLPAYLLGLGYTGEECEESGACAKTSDGRLIDAEGERLIIPIINHFDEVVAFGGRLIKKVDRAKYKNTRETPLFNKSKNLFNINLVKKEKRAGGISSLIMVEGYMDAISLYQAGFHNVVASMGTSLTKDQARLCRRYSENVFISYDGDFAGQKANLRGLDILKEEGIRVRVVPMPEGLDPDDVIARRGAEGYRACLDEAMPLIDFRIHAAKQKYDLQKTEDRRDFIKEVLPVVKEAESETEREELLKKIARDSGVSVAAIQRDLENLPRERAQEEPPPSSAGESADREEKAAYFVLAAALLSKPYAQDWDVNEIAFTGDLAKIADYIAEGRKQGRIRPSGIFDLMGSDSVVLSEVLGYNDGRLDSEGAERYFRDCLNTLRRREIGAAIANAKQSYARAESQEEKRKALLLIDEYTKKLNNLGGRT
ncbi:MAG: DNA primase, partial [Candidatus Gallimonas sp.]